MNLVYNAYGWDTEGAFCTNDATLYDLPVPDPRANAGFGWSVHLGQIVESSSGVGWAYIGPDGGQHGLYSRLHPGFPSTPTANVWYSNDATYFISLEGTRFNTGGLGNEVTKILKKSGVRRRTGSCHLFRHTMATLMLEGGADVRYLQEMLGHAKLDTTQIYTRVSIEKLKQIHEATHPARMERREDASEE